EPAAWSRRPSGEAPRKRSRAFYIQAKDTADNLLKSNQEVFQVTFNGPVTFTVVSAPVNPDAMDGLYKVEYLVNRAGNYRLSVALNGMPIKDSPFEFVARPGRVASEWSTVQGLGSIEFTAGTESEFVVQAKDAYGNALDEEVGEVTASIEWENYDSPTTMTVLDDTPLNNAEFGRYFYGRASYIGFGQYDIKYTALREGTHKLFVKINGGNVYLSPFTLRGSPAAAPYGPKSLAESGQPPASGVAGDEIVFHVQLRDAYGNLLASSPAGAIIVVRVSSAPPVSQVDEGVCSPSTGGSTGLYECRITPTVSGESVQVDGVEISKLEMVQPLQLTVTQGPFALFVEPAAVSPANTAVYNVQSSYLAGATVDALVQLRDRFGNNRTSSSATLLFQGRFGPSILAFTDNNDGTVTVKVGTHLAGEHPLQITLAGVQISNTPTPEIPVLSSIARFDGTDCAIPAEIIAGIQHPFQCVPRDTFGNKVVDNNLFIQAEFVNMDDSSAPVITVDGTYSLVDDNYDFPLEIDKVGAYSVVTQLWARGGLIGRYYRTPGFQSLVSLLTDRPHQGLALFEYTRVRDSSRPRAPSLLLRASKKANSNFGDFHVRAFCRSIASLGQLFWSAQSCSLKLLLR
ncbi:Ttn, partial [Symbiodinium necroappetens]